MCRAAWLVLLFLLAPPSALADTIVLKSGRRISATHVVEEGNRVYYETRSGRFSFPKSAVERIERGSFSEPSSSGAAELAVAAPRVEEAEGYADVARAAVHDGAIDRDYLTRLESEAQTGGVAAVRRLAAGYHAAAAFEFNRGDIERAIDLYRRGLIFAPDHLGLLLNLSWLYLQRSEYSKALEYLERAQRVAPNNADTAALLGAAYRGMNRLDRAVEEWKRALSLRPDPSVAAALEKAQRDLEEERSYREGESRHFTLRYNGKAAPELARDVLRTLERHFTAIESELNFTPPDPIAVTLYTEQAFADITRAPAWLGALNDGRMRVPVEGLSSVDAELSRVLKHELTHSFIRQKTRGPCPQWLNEGVAQWMEGKRSEQLGPALAQAIEAKVHGPVPPTVLEGSWVRLPPDMVGSLYALSLAMVEYIVRTDGMGEIERLLDRITTEPSTEAALRSTLRMDYEDLLRETARYLRRTYLR